MRLLNKKYIAIFTSVILLSSCAKLDDEVQSGIDIEKPVSVIVDEKVSSYDVIKSYAGNLTIGVNASLNNISESGSLNTLLTTNFQQITPISELNSNVILTNEGSYDFTAIDEYINTAEERGFSVYGDAIVSNFNQNNTFLTSLGSSLTYLTPLFPNIINQSPIIDGSFTGWSVKGNVFVEDYMGQPSLKLVNEASVNSSDATSLQSPIYTVDNGAKFELTFYLLSTQVGEGRVIFTGLNNNTPEVDWMGTGSASSTFTTKIGWNEIKLRTTDFDESGQFSFKIELGYTNNITYFVNIQGLSLINLNGSVDNPDEIFLECEDAQEIGQWMVTESGDASKVSGGKTLVGIIDGDIKKDDTGGGNPTDAINKDLQFTYTFNIKTSGTYRVWLRQKAHVADGGYDSFFMSVDEADYYCPEWPAWGNETNITSWTWFKLYTNSSDIETSSLFNLTSGEHKISIKIREGGHYFDKMYLTMTTNIPTDMGSSAIAQSEVSLNVSNDVKRAAVEKFFVDYVNNIISNLGNNIQDWTVVKNPFAEDGSVAVSGNSTIEGSFYWADYIGNNYIAQAFQIAKANINSDGKLFIGETNLNTNANKLNAIISSLNNIPEIDGIAVSLESLNIDTDLNEIESMFENLAATGKLIYITNLSVSIPNESYENFALQSEVYKTVVALFKSKIPSSQQYGISLSNAIDNNKGLWSSNYNRKQSYTGFVTGLGAQE
ncbi:MAG: endo-1,4-beta-xylanase [Marinilabiliaceae bacterium]|nr:endo-1,4-beta-xylanase [Marinilabiliaceae bacterium]